VAQQDHPDECDDIGAPKQQPMDFGVDTTTRVPVSPNNPFRTRARTHEPIPLEESEEVQDDSDEGQDHFQEEHEHDTRQTSIPFAARSDKSDTHVYEVDDVDRVHLTCFILRQLLHRTLTNIGAIALLRAVETTLTPSSWVRLVKEDLPAAEMAMRGQTDGNGGAEGSQQNTPYAVTSDRSNQVDGGDSSWGFGLLGEEIQGSGSWDDIAPVPIPPPPLPQPQPIPEPADELVPECKWLDSSDAAHAGAVVRDLECGAIPVSWLVVPNSTVTRGDPCCQEKLLWGDGLLLLLYAALAMWCGLAQTLFSSLFVG
jgi:hypothetical protein